MSHTASAQPLAQSELVWRAAEQCSAGCALQGVTVHDHSLTVHGAFTTPVDAEAIPTGTVEPVQGTPLDFTEAKPLRAALDELPAGIDNNFVLHSQEPDMRSLATEAGMVSSSVTCA